MTAAVKVPVNSLGRMCYILVMGKKKLWFSVGDRVVYPGYGVGLVEGFQERMLGGEPRSFCTLLVKENETESRVMIPLDNVDEVGLRALATKKDATEALNFLSEGTPPILNSWRERFAAHGEMLAKGDLPSVAMVLKALYTINAKKPLSFREKKMYQKALSLLTAEVGGALGKSRQAIEAEAMERLAGKKP